jgi:predicted permease
MIRHNLLIIYRNFKRFKTSFFINLIGLSTGLACTLLIYLWVKDELNVDKFHKKDSQLFQLMEHQQHTGSIRVTDSTPGLLAEALEEEIPEVEYAAVATPHYWFDKFALTVKDKNIAARGIYASKDYFNIFSYDLIHGNADQVLADKQSIVISQHTAISLFGTDDNVIGKSVEVQHDKQYNISGVFKGTPANSTVQFDFVLSFEVAKETNPGLLNWGNSGPMTFVVVKPGVKVSAFNKKISGVIKGRTQDTHRTLFASKYSDGYLYGNYVNGEQAGGRIEYVTMFSLIAAFILVIACINFMNLSTAKASRRIKEVGIKKAVGAGRRTLVMQYMGESLLMSFLSLFLSVLIVDLFLSQFNIITGKQLVLNLDLDIVLFFLSVAIITGLIAGSYPALYLSGFNPSSVLKGKFTTSTGALWARKGLVIFQFSISVIFIVSVLVIYNQIDFLQNKNLGYDKENVVYFPMEGKVKQDPETFINEVKKIPGVLSATSIGQSMVGGGNTTDLDWEGKDPETRISFAVRPVNFEALELLGIQMAEGRSFSKNFSTDSTKVIINEAALEVIGFKDPIGKVLKLGGGINLQILGVAKNFHFESLHTNVAPLIFVLLPQFTRQIAVKIEPGKERETLASVQSLFANFNPGFPFDYRFLDQDYQAQYNAEIKVAVLSRYFAGLAILISCLGLFGLAAFTAERRVKEIGIRKVMGSSVLSIVYLLSSDFTKTVFISILIALPISYFITSQWLKNFAYQIPLDWWYFILAGLIALGISWLTVGTQALKAASINPVKCLRDE